MKAATALRSEIIAMALDSIRMHKFRSFLTVLGIVIGVSTVIAIASILTGLRANLVNLIEEYGTNNIYGFHLTTGFSGGQDAGERTRKPLTEADAVAIREQAAAVEDVSMVGFPMGISTSITYQSHSYRRSNLQGVTANYAQVANVSVSEGRFITDVDDQHRRETMVIGVSVADALFRDHKSAIGQEVRLGDGRNFEIVGVLEKRKSAFLGENDEDNAVYIPFRTMRQISPGRGWILLIIQSQSGRIKQALDQVEGILRRQRGLKPAQPSDFDLGTAERFIAEFDNITALAGLIAIAMSGVGLLVGGIGVMNIMLVSVTERTPEIGVRKALGARKSDITTQFLCEAMTLTFFGGLLGVVLAVTASQIIMFFIPSLPASIPLWAVAAGLTVSIAIGLIFGVWPAWKASVLDPVECLRYE